MGIERRKEKRLRVALPVTVITVDKEELDAVTDNISRLGSYIEIDRQFDSGTEFQVTLEIPSYTEEQNLCGRIKCDATVFRCDPKEMPGGETHYGIGVFFTSFSDRKDREKLSRYVDYLITKEDETVKQGFKKWKEKKLEAESRKRNAYEKSLAEMNELLKKVLAKLEKIEKAVRS